MRIFPDTIDSVSDEHALVLLLWDVDHTLIENGGVSKENYALAFETLTGRRPDAQPVTDGRTDAGIMPALLRANGIDPSLYTLAAQLAALVSAGRSNESKLRSRGHALPGAADCLKRLAARDDVIQSVMTGNVEPNARIKLAAFGLDQWIDFAVGAFGETYEQRGRLVGVAQAKAAKKYGFNAGRDTTVVVGDTALDVEAGLFGGARVIGMATGTASAGELQAAGADAVVETLEPADEFVAALDRVVSSDQTEAGA
jgi:phosphoglycolate phosphatase